MLLYPFYKWESVGWEELSGCSKVTSWQVTEPWLKPKPPDSQSFAPSAAGEDMVLSPLMISHVLLWTQTYSKSLITKSYTPRVGRAHRAGWNFHVLCSDMPLQFMQPKFKMASLVPCPHYLNIFFFFYHLWNQYMFMVENKTSKKRNNLKFHQPHKTTINHFPMHTFGNK